MTGKLIAIGFLIALGGCQSTQDRQWPDMQTILEHTQPKKG